MNLFSKMAIIMNPERGLSAASNYNSGCVRSECHLLFREHFENAFWEVSFISFMVANIIPNAKGN